MATVERTIEAEADLLDIWLYIGRDNVSAADRFLDSMGQKFDALAEYPMMGRARPELAPDLRSFPVGNYIIFYRPIGCGVEIVRVLSGVRDIDSLF